MIRGVFAIAVGVSISGCAARQLDPWQSLSGQTTMVGCLNRGAGPDEFVLTERSGNGRTAVVGHPRLAMHANNHAVKIVGILERETNGNGLKAITIDHIAGSCAVPF